MEKEHSIVAKQPPAHKTGGSCRLAAGF